MTKRGANLGFLGVLCALALCGALASPGLSAESKSPREDKNRYKDWAKGPVRYLITRTESRLFRRQKTPEQRLNFIRRFWDRRDPNRVTPLNEARVGFWQRVQEANELFSPGSAKPGWKTDQGKIYILLGPPDDIETDENFDTGLRDSVSRGLRRWIYYGLDKSTTRAVTIVPFVRKDAEDWVITTEGGFADPNFNIYADPSVPTPNEILAVGGLGGFVDDLPWTRGTLGTAMDLGRLQEVPTERDLMRTVVQADDFIGNLDAKLLSHSLSTAGRTPVVAITLGVDQGMLYPGFEGSAIELAHRFLASATLTRQGEGDGEGEGESGAATVIEIPEDSFVAEPTPGLGGDDHLRIQALSVVPPGTWRVSAVLLDRGGGGAGVIESTIEVPALDPDKPRIAGPILATALTIAGGGGSDRPFVIDGAIVTPRMGGAVAHDEPFAVFLHVLPAAGTTDAVPVEWSITRKAPGSELAAPFGRPGRSEDGRGPRGWEFDAGQFEPGLYEIVFVASQEGRESTTRRITFEVAPSPEQLPSDVSLENAQPE